MAPQRGRFITLEGGDGVGKSTQCALLAAKLRSAGVEVVLTREPGGSPGAEAVRALLVRGSANRWDALSEALLMNAARRDHVSEVIQPALARGAWVVCDRYVDSSLVYQGLAGGVDLADLRTLHRLATEDLWPDLTFLLSISSADGLARATARHDEEGRFEAKGSAFQERVVAGFLTLAKADPQRIRLIEARRSVEEVSADLWSALQAWQEVSDGAAL